MQHPMPPHVAACRVCRPRWVAWREADYDPRRPANPGTASLMDERSVEVSPVSGRVLLREWQEELQVSQMAVVAGLCAAGRCQQAPTVLCAREVPGSASTVFEVAS